MCFTEQEYSLLISMLYREREQCITSNKLLIPVIEGIEKKIINIQCNNEYEKVPAHFYYGKQLYVRRDM